MIKINDEPLYVKDNSVMKIIVFHLCCREGTIVGNDGTKIEVNAADADDPKAFATPGATGR